MTTAVRHARIATWILLVVSVLPFLLSPYGIFNVVFYACTLAGLRRGIAWSAFGAALVTALNGIRIGIPQSLIALATILICETAAFLYLRAGMELKGDQPLAFRPGGGWIVVATIYVTVQAGLLLLTRTYFVSNDGMANTLLMPEYVLTTRRAPGSVQRGDVVAVGLQGPPAVAFYRVAGVPGDRIRLAFGHLIVNGSLISEPYVAYSAHQSGSYRYEFPSGDHLKLHAPALEMLAHVTAGELVVPSGKYFLLGDNRDDAIDSRDFGFIAQDAFLGTPLMVYWSLDATRYIETQDWTDVWWPKKMRWSRLFRLVR